MGSFKNRTGSPVKDLDVPLLDAKPTSPEQPKVQETWLEAQFKAMLYGIINMVVVTPVMIGFAAIIFRHNAFHKDPAVYAQLVKLVLFSSAVHQTAFTSFSSLPFAIGQVQDAGLIFLSQIASDVADQMIDDPPEHMLATTLVTLSLCTASLGVALMFTGYFKLAGLVQYLPLPVVGGYLAFIGLYCLEAGISLMSGLQVDNLLGLKAVEQWSMLLKPEPLYFCVPGVVLGMGILLVLQRFHHFLVLPGLLLSIPIAFYAVIYMLGFTLDECRDIGLVAAEEPQGNPLRVWTLFDFAHVRWDLVPRCLPTWCGMYIVVAFSSSLDVAAIQMDMGKQLDFNHELITVGLSNLLSGVTGGFTGSYIFSQTLFTFRTGTTSRACGILVLTSQYLLFLAPISIVSYVPKLFFGAVLTFIAADLMSDWLYHARSKVHPIEYCVILLTFLCINLFGLELGMCAGVLFSMVTFIYDYARVPVVTRVKLRSNVVRSLPLSSLLAEAQDQIITLRCRGYIFFGSTLQIMDSVMRSVTLPPSAASLAAHLVPAEDEAASPGSPDTPGLPGSACSLPSTSPPPAGGAISGLFGYKPPQPTGASPPIAGGRRNSADGLGERVLSGDSMSSLVPSEGTSITRYILFDFTNVSGLDATAARSCFLNLTRTLTPLGITILFGGVHKGSHIERLLIGHEILGVSPPQPEALRFDTIDEALEYCEEELLRTARERAATMAPSAASSATSRRDPRGPPAASILSPSLSLTNMLSPLVEAEWSDMLEGLAPFFRERRYPSGGVIFRKGVSAHSIYFITSGEVTLWAPKAVVVAATSDADGNKLKSKDGRDRRVASSAEDPAFGTRLVRYVDGGIFGELDFFLRHPRSFSAVASTPDTTVQVLTRDALQSMQSQAPQLAAALEHALLKYLSFQVNAKLGLSDGILDTHSASL